MAEVANRRVFYDFTFSPPKSVSIQALIADDKRLLESHSRAVRIAVNELQHFAGTQVHRGMDKSERLTGNVICATFRHDTSRALDPHLHTHCVMFNATFDATEQRWKALSNYEMLQARKMFITTNSPATCGSSATRLKTVSGRSKCTTRGRNEGLQNVPPPRRTKGCTLTG
jgi:conjugative relaxase-like TrwC/TraI family protein